MEDLSLLNTDDMINELAKRMEHMVFIGMRTNVKFKGDVVYHRKHIGDGHICVSLCEQMKLMFIHNIIADLKPFNER